MNRRMIVSALIVAAGFSAAPAMAASTVLKFDGGIGVVPVAIAGGAFVPNTVQFAANPATVATINPGGRPWMIEKLKATIRDDGSISAKGEGLIIGGGNNTGSNPPNIRFVGASLLCGSATIGTPPVTVKAAEFHSGAFAINTQGDFTIAGPLNAIPPNPCTDPVLLIRSATVATDGTVTLGNWFAAGIPGDSD